MEKTFCALVVVGGFMLVSACGSDVPPAEQNRVADEPVELTVFERSGVHRLCFMAMGRTVTFGAEFDGISGTLLPLLEDECSVERSSDTLRVSASVRAEFPNDLPTTEDSNIVTASCDPLALEPGEYQVEYSSFPAGDLSTATLTLEDDAVTEGCFDAEGGAIPASVSAHP